MSKIFTNIPPPHLLYDILAASKCELWGERVYVFDCNSYRRLVYLDQINPFLEKLNEYYTRKNRFYSTREYNKDTFTQFMTTLRQIAHANNIQFYNKIVYSRGDYNITYRFPKIIAISMPIS